MVFYILFAYWLTGSASVLVGECLQQLMTTPERDDPNVTNNEAPGDDAHVDITSPDLSVQEKITYSKCIKHLIVFVIYSLV